MERKFILFLILFIISHPTLAIVAPTTSPQEPNFKINEATIDSVQTAIKRHQITCEQLIKEYINRIKNYNLSVNSKPPINAITQINPYVYQEAQQLDAIYSTTQQLVGSLHCIPVLVKDNISSYDVNTTAGSYALLGNQPNQDAFLVSQLRKAGAIILGNASMDEFAWGMYGISSRNGRTGNAYDTSKNPGGSSGGSAVAVSANFTMIGIGTDNSGSVRIPAAFNGIFGLRPSTGLISQRGLFPMGNLDGVAGPLTRSVKDLALVLNVIAQPDSDDKKTMNIPRVKTYMDFLKENGLQGKRIGIVHHVGKIDTYTAMPQNVKDIFSNFNQRLHQLGATIIDNVDLPNFDNNRKNNMAGQTQDVNKYLASFPATRKNFRDICESDRTRTFGTVRQCLSFIKSNSKKLDSKYQQVLSIFKKNKNYVEQIMKTNHLDVLLIPISTQGSASYDPLTINPWQAAVSSNAGLPSIVLNAGYLNNMPVGVELIGKMFDEGTLIEIAYSYEKNSPQRIDPISPEENKQFSTLSISKLNNLFTLIGKFSYENVLQSGKTGVQVSEMLTPEIFRKLVQDQLLEYQSSNL